MKQDIQRLVEAGIQDHVMREVIQRLAADFGPDLLIHQARAGEKCVRYQSLVGAESRASLRSQSARVAQVATVGLTKHLEQEIRALISPTQGARLVIRDTVKIESASRSMTASLWYRIEPVEIQYATEVREPQRVNGLPVS